MGGPGSQSFVGDGDGLFLPLWGGPGSGRFVGDGDGLFLPFCAGGAPGSGRFVVTGRCPRFGQLPRSSYVVL